MFKNLKFENKDGIAHLTVNRPDKLNALNIETIEEIKQAFHNIYDDADIRGVIITGEGEKAFVAGADISEIGELTELNGRKFAENGQEVFGMIENCHKPVIPCITQRPGAGQATWFRGHWRNDKNSLALAAVPCGRSGYVAVVRNGCGLARHGARG